MIYSLLLILSFLSPLNMNCCKVDSLKWHTVTTNSVSFQYPSLWKVKEKSDTKDEVISETTFSFFKADEYLYGEESLLGQFMIINLQQSEFSRDSIYTYFEENVATRANSPDYIIQEETYINRFDSEIYKVTFIEFGNILSINKLLYVWVIDKSAYVLGFKSNAGTYEAIEPIYERIFNSIKITNSD